MLTKQQMRAYYDAIFSDYFRYIQRFKPGILTHPVLDYFTRLKFEHLRGHNIQHLLDIGCGTGFYYPLLSQFAKQITGIDYSEQMIRICDEFINEQEITNATVSVMDMEQLTFEGKKFDAVLSMDVFHHTHDIPKIIDQVANILEPHGIFLVVEVNPTHPLALAHNLYRPEERGVLKTFPWKMRRHLQNRFSIEYTAYLQYFPFFLTKTSPTLLPLIKRWEKWCSAIPGIRFLSVYYIMKCKPLT